LLSEDEADWFKEYAPDEFRDGVAGCEDIQPPTFVMFVERLAVVVFVAITGDDTASYVPFD